MRLFFVARFENRPNTVIIRHIGASRRLRQYDSNVFEFRTNNTMIGSLIFSRQIDVCYFKSDLYTKFKILFLMCCNSWKVTHRFISNICLFYNVKNNIVINQNNRIINAF